MAKVFAWSVAGVGVGLVAVVVLVLQGERGPVPPVEAAPTLGTYSSSDHVLPESSASRVEEQISSPGQSPPPTIGEESVKSATEKATDNASKATGRKFDAYLLASGQGLEDLPTDVHDRLTSNLLSTESEFAEARKLMLETKDAAVLKKLNAGEYRKLDATRTSENKNGSVIGAIRYLEDGTAIYIEVKSGESAEFDQALGLFKRVRQRRVEIVQSVLAEFDKTEK